MSAETHVLKRSLPKSLAITVMYPTWQPFKCLGARPKPAMMTTCSTQTLHGCCYDAPLITAGVWSTCRLCHAAPTEKADVPALNAHTQTLWLLQCNALAHASRLMPYVTPGAKQQQLTCCCVLRHYLQRPHSLLQQLLALLLLPAASD